jgi:O-antigen ligase
VRAQAGETLENNSAHRTQFWREALVAFGSDPVSGAGYGRVAAASHGKVPVQWAVSPLAHSGPLQALGEGGLLLAVPLFALLGAVLVGLVRRLRRPLDPDRPDTLVVRSAIVAALLLGIHALVDTDWSYPALAAQAAVVTALALAVPLPSRAPRVRPRPGAASVVVLVVALGCAGAAAWGQPFHISASTSDQHTTSGGGHS